MRSRALPLLACLAALPACVVGAPPGFSDGDTWTMPLIAPLEDDVLLVPVTINGKGPYLFMIDPDSEVSSVDNAIVSELELYATAGPDVLSEADHRVKTFIAEVPEAQIGELGIRNQKWRIHKVGTFWAGGRRVRGLLGRDVIADSLMFSVDRDRGVATIGKQGKLSPPTGADTISYRNFFNRKLAKVALNGGAEVTLHLDLGGRLSRMWPDKIRAMNLPQIPLQAKLVDELGVEQTVTGGALAASVTAGASEAKGVVIVPFADKRLETTDLDGSLGQNFFANFKVLANWHKKTLWLERRSGDLHAGAAERMGRWRGVLGDCQNPGCVSATLERVTAGASRPASHPELFAAPGEPASDAPAAPVTEPAPQALVLTITREASASAHRLEFLLDAVDASGKTLGLPRLQGTFMPGKNQISAPLDATTYAGAAGFAVLDVNPLGRACAKEPCLWLQTVKY